MKKIILICAVACAVAISVSASAADVGVVFLHGKWGTPNAPPIKTLAAAMESAGFVVETPEMPWSRNRAYDKDVEGALAEIDGVVQRLKTRGAQRIVVGGQSIGANIAMAYGARREGLAGVLAIAPGHIPEFAGFRKDFEADYQRARGLLASDKADTKGQFADTNQGKVGKVTASARVYVSWMDPQGAAVIPLNAAALKPGAPLLWMVGQDDGMAQRGEAYAYAKAPAHPKNAYKLVRGGHGETPAAGAAEIVAWLKGL